MRPLDRPLDAAATGGGGPRVLRAVLVLITITAVVALALTYLHSTRAQVDVRTGAGQWVASERAANLADDDGALGLYSDGRWIDSSGDWHLGGRPDCLPADGRVVDVAVGVVDIEAEDGFAWQQVAFVSCAPQ